MDSTSVTSEQLARLSPGARADFLRYRAAAREAYREAGEAREKARYAKDPIIRRGWETVAHSRAQSAIMWDRLAMQTLRTAG